MDPDFLPTEASRYIASLLPPASPVMARLHREAQKEEQPAVNPQTGALLRVLAAATGGKRVLEVGTNLGYGALWLLSGMPASGHLDTIEIDPEMVRRARAGFEEAGVAKRVTVHEGAALDVLPRLAPGYDLIFLDCVKEEYPLYLEHAKRLLRPGGIVAADNLLWHGNAWDPRNKDASTLALRAYAATMRDDPRLVSTLVPTGDGLGISVVR
jgi:predicted O-methyltransferase YrrM